MESLLVLLELFPDVLDLMADPYRELLDNRPMIEQIVSMEEKRFGRTLQQGTELIEQEISRLRLRHVDALSGTIAFELYDTYGFPLELTTEICAENDIKVDEAGFHVEMEKQRERARASSKQLSSEMKGDVYSQIAAEKGQTSFEGYVLSELDTEVVALIKDGQPVDFLSEGESGEAVLKVSPFYAERGGEIGDQGLLSAAGVKVCVTDTTSETADLIVHRVTVLEGVLTEGLAVHASVDKEKRESIRRNHTATHLLHEALSQVLGSHVRQAGSLVNEALLRFDFTHFESMTREQIAAVEDMVNRQILKNIPLETIESDLEQAREMGAKALFDEKYGDIVRVVRIKDFSTELCGGLHVDATGDIGAFKIIKEEGIGSGTRRITALTGLNAFRAFQNSFRVVEDLCNVLTLTTDELVSHVENMQAEIKGLGRKIDELKLNNLAAAIDESVKKEILSNGTSIFQGSFKGVSADMLRELCDRIKVKNKNIVIVLASQISEENVLIVAMADDEAMKAGAHAGKIVKEVAVILGGGGGGKPAIAQAGGKKPEKIDEAFHALRGIVEKQMGV
jgi:alanyl-tRNA synthetase